MSYKSKDPLTIRLTESVVFLRGSPDAVAGRRRHDVGDGPPAMLRGLLALHLTKPTRISSIEIQLDGKSSIQWPEGVGHRRVDVPEEHQLLSARSIFFSAKAGPVPPRSASLGPGARGLDEDDEEHNDDSRAFNVSRARARMSLDPSTFTAPHSPGTVNLAPPPLASRRNSSDQYAWQGDPTAATLSSNPPPTPPYTPEPVYSPLYSELPVSRPQTPTDSRPESSTQHRHNSRTFRTEENPGQMLEEFRNALRMEMGNRPSPSRTPSGSNLHAPDLTSALAASSTSSLKSLPGNSSSSAPGSRSNSRDAEHRQPHSASLSANDHSSPSRAVSPTSTPPAAVRIIGLPPTTRRSPEHEQDLTQPRDKRSSRWSLSNMSSVLKDVKGKVRSGSPRETEFPRGRTPERRSVNGSVDFAIGNDEPDTRQRDKERKSALSKLTAAVGLDEPSSAEGWKEFRKGTYTYPISFTIPATAPPTLHCDFGSVIYRLKAVVHRPGALTTKLAVSREVTLVASPAEDDTEETHSIVVERQWDVQLRYLIALSGRSFTIGSQVPFNLTMFPLEKCKVYRVSVFLEEKTEYFARSKTLVREQPVKRFELLSIKHPEKHAPPILPMGPEGAPLLTPYLDTSSFSSVDEGLSSLMGPGPWALSHDLQLPRDCGTIHFTYKHKGASITVNHVLKVVFRVERGDDQYVDPRTGKRRMFDIVVQTPIHILSCHCNPKWTALPQYSLFDSGISDPSGAPGRTCACSGRAANLAPYSTSFVPAPATSRPSTAEHRPDSNGNALGIVSIDNGTSARSDLADSSYQFARLVSGQEGVLGEAPPGYQEALAQRL